MKVINYNPIIWIVSCTMCSFNWSYHLSSSLSKWRVFVSPLWSHFSSNNIRISTIRRIYLYNYFLPRVSSGPPWVLGDPRYAPLKNKKLILNKYLILRWPVILLRGIFAGIVRVHRFLVVCWVAHLCVVRWGRGGYGGWVLHPPPPPVPPCVRTHIVTSHRAGLAFISQRSLVPGCKSYTLLLCPVTAERGVLLTSPKLSRNSVIRKTLTEWQKCRNSLHSCFNETLTTLCCFLFFLIFT